MIDTANVRTGTYAAKCSGAGLPSSFLSAALTTTTTTHYYLRCYYRFGNLPAGSGSYELARLVGPSRIVGYLNSDGSVTAGIASGVTIAPAGSVVAGTYFSLEFHWMIDTGNSAAAVLEARFNYGGTVALSLSSATLVTSVSLGVVSLQNSPGAFDLWLDDVAINDSSGTAQNSWAGPGKVVLLNPISDSAVGAGWTLGTGTAISSNGFDSLNNLPPTGAADLAALSDPKQIRNASANANTNYDANLTTYTTAGVSAIDLISVAIPLVATAAPVTTSAKAGTIGIVSNPPITNVALGATGTAGAFWQGNTAGTYATGWKWSAGTTTYTPYVSVATSPVARITQVTSSTRIAMVCALALYLEYLPGGLSPSPPVHIPFMR